MGGHLVKSWSSTQRTIALSSAEAERYAIVKGVAQAKGINSLLADFGFTANCEINTAASAAPGIVHRTGLGKT